MKNQFISVLAVTFMMGCSSVQTPVVPRVVGCTGYCYPKSVLIPNFVSLTRTNSIRKDSGTWAGGVMPTYDGDHVELTCTTAVCSNMPQAGITFCLFCRTNTVCFDKNIPANGYTMSWDVSINCTNCVENAANGSAALCPGGQNVPHGLWDYANGHDGRIVSVKQR